MSKESRINLFRHGLVFLLLVLSFKHQSQLEVKMTKDTATYCKKYIESELADLKEKRIWNSWHPVMQQALDRHEEMTEVYWEIMRHPEFDADYLVKYDQRYIGNSPLQLTLETFWSSKKEYAQESVARKRECQKELIELHAAIGDFARRLSEAMSRYYELLELGGYEHDSYTSVTDLIDSACMGNGHYEMYLKKELKSLDYQFDGKYWPDLQGIVQAISEHFVEAPEPRSRELPQSVMEGRQAPIKDYVLAVDRDLLNNRQIPNLQLSHAAMATVVNVVLDLTFDSMVTGETIRQIRNRHQQNRLGKR